MLKPYACLALFCSLLLPSFAHADDSDVGCVTTEWKLLGANHKVCVSAFNDPDIPGVALKKTEVDSRNTLACLGSLAGISIGPT